MKADELKDRIVSQMRDLAKSFTEGSTTPEQQQAVEPLYVDLGRVKTLGDAISLLFEYFDSPRPAFAELLKHFVDDLTYEDLVNSDGFDVSHGPRIMFTETPR